MEWAILALDGKGFTEYFDLGDSHFRVFGDRLNFCGVEIGDPVDSTKHHPTVGGDQKSTTIKFSALKSIGFLVLNKGFKLGVKAEQATVRASPELVLLIGQQPIDYIIGESVLFEEGSTGFTLNIESGDSPTTGSDPECAWVIG